MKRDGRARNVGRAVSNALIVTALASTVSGCCGFGPCAPPGLEKIDIDWDLQVDGLILPLGGESLVLDSAGRGPRAISYDRPMRRA